MTGPANGYRIPPWLIATVIFLASVFGAGWVMAEKVSTNLRRITSLEEDRAALGARLCRIETALHIPRWPTCE